MAEGGFVVAICQYGGEFTSGPNGNLIYKGGEAHAVDVSREMPLDSFKDEVSKVFHVDVTDMSFKYFLPNNNRTLITVSCDRDLQRMVDFTASAAQVDVFVISRVENRSIVPYTGASTVKAGSNAQADKRKRPASKSKTSKSNKKTPIATSAAVQTNTHDINQPSPVVTLNDYNEEFQVEFGRDVAFVATDGSVSSDPDVLNQDKLALVDTEREPTGIIDDAINAYDGSEIIIDPPPELTYNPNVFWDDIIKGVGQEFDNVKDFRAQLCKYAIGKGFVYRFIKNETTRVTVKCVGDGCTWRLHASESSRSEKFVIKKMTDEHTCGGVGASLLLHPREREIRRTSEAPDAMGKPAKPSPAAPAPPPPKTVHSPLLTYASMLSLLSLCPPFVILLWYTMVHADGSVLGTYQHLRDHGLVEGLRSIWPMPTVAAGKIILGFALFEAALQLLLPGKRFEGPISPSGNVPVYKANGLQAYAVTLVAYLSLWWFGIFNPAVVYDHLGEIFSALVFGSLVFCVFLYIKGHVAPSSSDSGSSGNPIIDFYWGMELYPRIGKHFDIKVFTNCRFGMMSWAVLAVTYCIKQYEMNGQVADSMLVNTALMLIYITKFFWWESGYWCTMDIAHDRAGFYICWGCLVWVPSIYTSPGMYLVNHPVNLGPQLALSILLAGILCIYINYDCDRQRQEFRRTNGKCTVWGKAPSKIVASYQTTKGETKTSLLLTSGWWAVARHFHYVPEILSAFFWTVPALFDHFLPYFYVIFLTILLLDRAKRDDDRCSSKYGKYWKTYCNKVRYRVIPGIY